LLAGAIAAVFVFGGLPPAYAGQTATETAWKGSPAPHPVFGYNEDWRPEMVGLPPIPGRLDLLPGSGADVTRQLLLWGWIEGPTGERRWERYDRFYGDLLARGIRPLWVIYGVPYWVDPGSSAPWNDHVFSPPNPEAYDELASFAAEAAVRYPDSLGFEVWNEPNDHRFWGGTPDPQRYAEMVRQVAEAVDAVDPAMPVVTAGLAPVRNGDSEAMDSEKFLRRAYRAGGPQHADAIGAHPYPLRSYDEAYLGSVRTKLRGYRSVMRRFGDAGKPLWVTETGVSTLGKDEGYTQDQQAKALVRIYSLFRRASKVPVVIFHKLFDTPEHNLLKERGYGVVDGDGNPKPAYCAIAAARGRPC
jgi:polysaccharide biosynthesis protein PslG